MGMVRWIWAGAAVGGSWLAAAQTGPSFETDVFPIFQKHCAGCHFPEAGRVKGKLDLSTLAATLAGGALGPSIVPGDAAASEFIGMLEHTVEPFMPPPDKFPKLDAAQIETIKAWIAAGAPGAVQTPVPLAETAAPVAVNLASAVGSAAFAPHADPPLLARGRLHGVELVRIDRATGAETPEALLPGHAEMVRALSFSPDGTVLAAAGGRPGRSGEVVLWDVATHKLIRRIEGHRDNILAAAFSPDGTQLATASYDKTIILWDTATGEETMRLVDHVDAVFALAYSPDGSRLASGAGDRTVKIWDPKTGAMALTISDSTEAVHALAFSPDGKRLAGAGGDKMIRLWGFAEAGAVFQQSETSGGTLLRSMFAHDGPVLALAFGPDGSTLYSTGEDRLIKAWDGSDLTEKLSIGEQSDWVTGLAVSPDGAWLAAGRYDASSALYDAATGTALGAVETAGAEAGGRKKITTLAVDAVLITATVPPSLQSVAPDRAARGGPVELTVTGRNLDGAEPIFTHPAIRFAAMVVEPGEKPNLKSGDVVGTGAAIRDDAQPYTIKLTVELPADVPPGFHELMFRTTTGMTNGVGFNVLAQPDLSEAEPNDATAQAVAWPNVVIGAIAAAGDVDRYAVEAAAGQELTFVLTDTGLNPVMRLLDPDGAEAQTNKGMGLDRMDVLGHRFDRAGTWTLEVGDADLRGNLGYRLHIGAFPLATSLWPLGVQAGKTAAVQAEGYNLGGAEIAVTAPESATHETTIPLPVPAAAGNPLPGARIAVGPYEEIAEGGANDAAAEAMGIAVPMTVNGRIESPDDADCFRIDAKAGEEILIEVMAGRLGSPLDSVVDILTPDGAVLERGVIRCVAQTKVTLSNRDSKQGGIRLDTWRDLAMDDYVMVGAEILQIAKIPDYGDEDVVFRQYANGQRMGMFGTTPEHHAVDAPAYKVEIHPAGSTFAPNGMPLFPLYWRNDDGFFGDGDAAGDSFLAFTAPADGTYVVRIRDARGLGGETFAYRLMARRAAPDFDVVAGAYRMNVSPGGRTPFEVRIRRKDGFDEPVEVAVHGLPDGLRVAPSFIEPGQTSVRLALEAEPGAQSTGPMDAFRVTASAQANGAAIVRETHIGAVTVSAVRPDLDVITAEDTVVLEPGRTAVINVRLDRYNGVDCRIPVDVLNLPYGVRVMDTGLNGILVREGETERRIELYAEPWVAPIEKTIYVQAQIESNPRPSFVGPGIALRVDPAAGRIARDQ